MRAKALVVFPGGYGTLDELFETLTLIQTKKIKPIPVLIFGREFWGRIVNFDALIEEGTISPEDIDIFKYVDTAEDAWAIISRLFDVSWLFSFSLVNREWHPGEERVAQRNVIWADFSGRSPIRGLLTNHSTQDSGVDEPSLQFWGRSTGIRTSFRRKNHGINGGLYRAKTRSPAGLRPRLAIHSISCSVFSS